MQLLSALLLALYSLVVAGCLTSGAELRSTEHHSNTTRLSRRYNFDNQPCGTSDDLIIRVDQCAAPLMDILAGRMKAWPKTEDDTMNLCEEFGYSERCIKEASRKCAKGIQRTIVSTLATSVQRVRKRECSKSKAAGILKTTQCMEKNQLIVQDWMASVTSRLAAVEKQQPVPEKKINAICCMVNDIEKEFKNILDPFCPSEAKFLQRLFRGVVDNAVDIICRQPKCNDYLKGYTISKSKDIDGLISIILRIVFSLDSNE